MSRKKVSSLTASKEKKADGSLVNMILEDTREREFRKSITSSRGGIIG
jgi:hypothetical protein